ncbi:MAG: hypothetical protein FWF81_04810 [Defluviitaleaceae bacterium]|nr:hypothetical protein [Defluviitaleaceae bacterium]
MEKEEVARFHRDIYSSKKAMGDIRSGLNKFLDFLNYGYNEQIEMNIQQKLNDIVQAANLSATVREAIVKARVGQGVFRRDLIDY